jgi:SRSO17 transposase
MSAEQVSGLSDICRHFISDSPWDFEPVIAHIQRDIIDAIGDEHEGSIHIDETGFPKQGNDSVGVKRQYCGRLGKVENCQVAVFLGYSKGPCRSLLDMRLYVPPDWTNDPVRRSKCGIPEDLEFKTKSELGLEMILNARKNGMPFGWVGMDGMLSVCHLVPPARWKDYPRSSIRICHYEDRQ